MQWGIEGDENSSYFHRIINCKRRQLAICGIVIDEVLVDDPIWVKHEFCSFYQSLFSSQQGPRLSTNPNFFATLSDSQRDLIHAPFSVEEIKSAVWDCGSNKASGTYGFSFYFSKKYWDVMSKKYRVKIYFK